MSYQVLARKWRPRGFAEMVGQEHVLRALSNALDSGRLHHAFLFAGTRGVGKTTLARILAKSLNCEQGISSTPCGECNTCKEINEGRFVDLIEVDAASRTKVEDTRELLDNVQYAPTRGRFKVYLIDEIHMLSGHSFNALLKTLEEPPPHVKFLLATTDPQKLPVTILSRCLQFNLRRLSVEKIQAHLELILGKENIDFESAALLHMARAADGSMRDALSLLDQAIAFGNGSVNENDVREMLGSIEQYHVYDLLDALALSDGDKLIRRTQELAQMAPDFSAVLAEVITCLHYLALLKLVPNVYEDSMGDKERLLKLANTLSAEDVQLYYQIALHGRRDLPLAPEPRAGLEMVLLRMLAFRPDDGSAQNRVIRKTPELETITRPDNEVNSVTSAATNQGVTLESTAKKNTSSRPTLTHLTVNNWYEVVTGLSLGGILQQLAEHCAFINTENNNLNLALEPSNATLLTDERALQLQQALSIYFNQSVQLHIETTKIETETPAVRNDRKINERQLAAEQSIVNDDNVKNIMEVFNARVDIDSIKPLNN